MLLLYTDFGSAGPYVGQLHGALSQQAPGLTVIDLMHDAPRFNPVAAGRLLTALTRHFPRGCVCMAVIDPGVGGPRRPLAVRADGHWFVGPDNGLFAYLGNLYSDVDWFEILWRPDHISASFHGRDLFAPVAARLATNKAMETLASLLTPIDAPVPRDLQCAEIIYIDGFGNAMTGLDANLLPESASLSIHGSCYAMANTFSDLPVGKAFWYCNSLGLAELAVNRGSAASILGLAVGYCAGGHNLTNGLYQYKRICGIRMAN